MCETQSSAFHTLWTNTHKFMRNTFKSSQELTLSRILKERNAFIDYFACKRCQIHSSNLDDNFWGFIHQLFLKAINNKMYVDCLSQLSMSVHYFDLKQCKTILFNTGIYLSRKTTHTCKNMMCDVVIIKKNFLLSNLFSLLPFYTHTKLTEERHSALQCISPFCFELEILKRCLKVSVHTYVLINNGYWRFV